MSTVSTERLELPIKGMTCASCASRIERKLNRLDGVTASVNYATEKAAVEFDPAQVDARRIDRRGRAGRLLGAPATGRGGDRRGGPCGGASPTARLRRGARPPHAAHGHGLRAAVHDWQWLALQLATPVVLWAAGRSTVAAWKNLRHGAATMDTLISLGTLAALGWSVVALFFLDAGKTGMKMPFDLVPSRTARARDQIYLEVAAVVDHVPPRRPVLRGAREAPRRGGAACACSSSAPRTSPCSTRRQRAARPDRAARASATASSSGPARRSPPTASSSRGAPPSTSRC